MSGFGNKIGNNTIYVFKHSILINHFCYKYIVVSNVHLPHSKRPENPAVKNPKHDGKQSKYVVKLDLLYTFYYPIDTVLFKGYI